MNSKKINSALSIFSIVAGLASIGGLFIALFADKDKAIIALCTVVIALLAILSYVFYLGCKLIQRENPNAYLKLSLFCTFEQIDETHSKFDGYRLIQSKRPILKQVSWGFHWSGSKLPQVSSSLQICDGKINVHNNSYDDVILRLNKPLLFNETAVLHFHADMDDIDHTALPHLDIKVDSPISLAYYRVVLNNGVESMSNAKFMRMPIDSNRPLDYEVLDTVAFDSGTRSYQHILTNPEVGYYYRLAWEK